MSRGDCLGRGGGDDDGGRFGDHGDGSVGHGYGRSRIDAHGNDNGGNDGDSGGGGNMAMEVVWVYLTKKMNSINILGGEIGFSMTLFM